MHNSVQDNMTNQHHHVLIVNIFLVILIPLLFLDSTPFHPFNVDWLVQPLGIWQGTWKLFAPHINTANVQFEAVVVLSRSSSTTAGAANTTTLTPRSWRSPDWSHTTVADKIRYFRWMKYYESVSNYPALYLPLAEYSMQQQQQQQQHDNNTHQHEDVVVSVVRLYQWTQYPLHAPPSGAAAASRRSSSSSIHRAWTPPARQWLRTFQND